MRLIEPFGGSLAVTMHLLGGAAPCSWPGSKRFYTKAIVERLRLTRPAEVVLAEPSPWYYVWKGLEGLDPAQGWADLVEATRALTVEPEAEKETWLVRRANFRPEALSYAEAGAMWLWLLKRSYGNKGPQAGYCPREITMGPRSNFGKYRYRLDDPWFRLAKMNLAPPLPTFHVYRDHADIPLDLIAGSTLYVDPPYPGTTPYAWGDELDLPAVAALAGGRWGLARCVGLSLPEDPPAGLLKGFTVHELPRRERPGRNRSKQQRELLLVRGVPPV